MAWAQGPVRFCDYLWQNVMVVLLGPVFLLLSFRMHESGIVLGIAITALSAVIFSMTRIIKNDTKVARVLVVASVIFWSTCSFAYLAIVKAGTVAAGVVPG